MPHTPPARPAPASRAAPLGAALLSAALLAAAPRAAAQGDAEWQDWQRLPPQVYSLDPAHSSVVFSASHLGFSAFTASFDTIAATLELDVAAPQEARLSVAIQAASLDLPDPGGGFLETMLGETWLKADAHPEITFVSTAVTPTGPQSAEIAGALTIRGVTRPAVLDATFNGGYAAPPWEPNSRLGFSATASILRSEFGMDFGVPAPGSTLGVGDAVEIRIEAEFVGPKAP